MFYVNNLQESLLVQTLGFVSKGGAIGGQEWYPKL
jgi:hypothetical protein